MQYRVEDKYRLNSRDMFILENRVSGILRKDPMAQNQGYTISSLYFDDIANSCYKNSVEGNPKRRKFRIRIYNNSFETIKLEVKEKIYNKAVKYGSIISKEEMLKLISGRTIDEKEGDTAVRMFNFAIKTQALRPRVVVAYERCAYVCEEGNVRVTFDRNIRASDNVDFFGNEDVIYDYPPEASDLLEVKYDEFIPRYVTQAIETNRLIQTANSKYVICFGLYKR